MGFFGPHHVPIWEKHNANVACQCVGSATHCGHQLRVKPKVHEDGLRYNAFVYRVEIKNCIFLEYVQKRREADDEFEFTKYIVQEITLVFNFLKKVCMK